MKAYRRRKYTRVVNRVRAFWMFVLLQLALLTALRAVHPPIEQRSPLKRPIRTVAPVALPDVAFTDLDGREVRLHALRGRVALLAFSNVQCVEESACVRPLSAYAQVAAALGARSAEVVFVFIGVDERVDRPLLRECLGDADVVGWTASAAELKTLTLRLGVHMNEEDDVLLAHAPFIFVLDQRTHLRVYVPKDAPIDELIFEVRRLLR